MSKHSISHQKKANPAQALLEAEQNALQPSRARRGSGTWRTCSALRCRTDPHKAGRLKMLRTVQPRRSQSEASPPRRSVRSARSLPAAPRGALPRAACMRPVRCPRGASLRPRCAPLPVPGSLPSLPPAPAAPPAVFVCRCALACLCCTGNKDGGRFLCFLNR